MSFFFLRRQNNNFKALITNNTKQFVFLLVFLTGQIDVAPYG